jgi:hypothetical protein
MRGSPFRKGLMVELGLKTGGSSQSVLVGMSEPRSELIEEKIGRYLRYS